MERVTDTGRALTKPSRSIIYSTRKTTGVQIEFLTTSRYLFAEVYDVILSTAVSVPPSSD